MPPVKAHMAGTIVDVSVGVGDKVDEGQEVACLESMKMQMGVPAESAGTVTAVKVAPGDFVNEGDVLVELG